MKIEVVTSSGKFEEDHDYRSYLKIIKDDESLLFLDGEPEDANLCRDFSDCYSIVEFMKAAYYAGKNGESLEINTREIDDWE